MVSAFTIFIADDDADDRDIFCDIIREICHEGKCMTAIDGVDALEKLKAKNRTKPDLIFLDINMPRLNGKQCLCELKKDPSLCNIPVVIYSTSRLIKDFEEISMMNGIEFLTKPCTSKDLKIALTFMLEKLLPKIDSPKWLLAGQE